MYKTYLTSLENYCNRYLKLQCRCTRHTQWLNRYLSNLSSFHASKLLGINNNLLLQKAADVLNSWSKYFMQAITKWTYQTPCGHCINKFVCLSWFIYLQRKDKPDVTIILRSANLISATILSHLIAVFVVVAFCWVCFCCYLCVYFGTLSSAYALRYFPLGVSSRDNVAPSGWLDAYNPLLEVLRVRQLSVKWLR